MPIKIRIALLVLAAAATALLTSGTAHAIANGDPVPDGKYTFSTKLTMTNIPQSGGGTYNSACSGALVAPQWVITAGHCFHDVRGTRVSGPTPYATTATVGRTDLADTDGYVVTVIEVRQSSKADVALVKLATPIPADVAPIPVSTATVKSPRSCASRAGAQPAP